MCGIAGMVQRDLLRKADRVLRWPMCTSLGHSGPDDQGTFLL
jgi:asparagine synthetase B (glutamine-hydrolysing)